jgi:hypothetical protein
VGSMRMSGCRKTVDKPSRNDRQWPWWRRGTRERRTTERTLGRISSQVKARGGVCVALALAPPQVGRSVAR